MAAGNRRVKIIAQFSAGVSAYEFVRQGVTPRRGNIPGGGMEQGTVNVENHRLNAGERPL
jgi:hypothetical protein